MSDLRTTLGQDRVELDFDEASFSRDAVYAAAFTFIDRCWVRLDKGDAGRLGVVLRAKSTAPPGSFDGEALAADLRNEILGQAFRQRLADEGRALTDAVVRGAFGGADSPAIDDLLAGGADFEDPLGIALAWDAGQPGVPPQTPGQRGVQTATAEPKPEGEQDV